MRDLRRCKDQERVHARGTDALPGPRKRQKRDLISREEKIDFLGFH